MTDNLHTMILLSGRGHTDLAAWPAVDTTAEAQAAINEAERIFGDHQAKGETAFDVSTPGDPAVRLDAFDPKVARVMFIPRMAGGS